MENRFTSIRLIDRKPKKVIVDETGDIVNRNPSKDELKCLEEEPSRYTNEYLLGGLIRFYKEHGRVPTKADLDNNPKYPSQGTYTKHFGGLGNAIRDAGLWKKRYNDTHTCDRCGKSFEEIEKLGRTPLQENDKDGNWTGKWDCYACRSKYDPNSYGNLIKSMSNCRTGSQNPNHSCTKGEQDVELACRLYGYIDLNKKYDNHGTEIDCLDEKTGLYHQIRGRSLGIISRSVTTKGEKYYEGWHFTRLEREWYKEYENMIFFCKNKDRKIVEEIYKIPHWEMIGRKSIGIYKDMPRRVRWYEQYRVKDPGEIKRANELWQKILEEQ